MKANFSNEGETGTHNVGTSGNEDWRGKAGTKYEGQQFIWDPRAGSFDHSDVNKGTYDYVSPRIGRVGDHFEMDVDPWLVWGTTPADRGDEQSMFSRMSGLRAGKHGELAYEFWFEEGEHSLYGDAHKEWLRKLQSDRTIPEVLQEVPWE